MTSTSFIIESAEGLPIRGDLHVPAKARAIVVLVHGFKGFKDWAFFPWLADFLASERFAVVRFNMSRSGIGEEPESFDRLDLFEHDTYSTQIDDLQRVVDHARSGLPSLPLFLLGHSRGGGVSLLGASGVKGLAGVVTWSSIARADRWDAETRAAWRRDGYLEIVNVRTQQVMRASTAILDDFDANADRLDILAATARLDVPLLVLHGSRDDSVPVAEAHEIAGQARDHSAVIIGGAGHTYNAIHPLVHVPFQLTLAAEITAKFIAAYC